MIARPPNDRQDRAQAADSMIPDRVTEEQALMLIAYIAVGAPRQWSADACRRALRKYFDDDDFSVPIDRLDPLVLQQWADLAAEWGADQQIKGRDF
jgi:hypothetical protein